MLKMSTKILYGVGDMGLSITYFTLGFFFIYFMTDILHLPPALAGLAYFIGQAWDSINDPFIGAINDKVRSIHGRKRLFLLLGALPFALSFILIWQIPQDLGTTAKFILATIALLFYTTFYSILVVPYFALVPIITQDYDERTQITGIRSMLSTLGTLMGGGTALLVLDGSNELTTLHWVTAIFGLIAGLAILTAAQSVRSLEKTAEVTMTAGYTKFNEYLRLFKDRNVAILMLFKYLGAIATGGLLASLPYFARHILGDEGISTIGMTAYVLVAAACIPIWERLARRIDKRHLLLAGSSAAAAILLAIGFLTQPGSTVVFYAGCTLLGVVMSSYLLIPYSLPPDLVEYYQHLTGERHEALIFGAWTMAHTFGVGTAGLLLGTFLQIFKYNGALETQTTSAQFAVRMGLGLLPGLFLVIAALSLLKYTITRKVYEETRRELEQRSIVSSQNSEKV